MDNFKIATFAGGCFWCIVEKFKSYEGVLDTRVGYTGGDISNPTYKEVKSQESGHYEAIQIAYNPEKIDYEKLLWIFWTQIDPTDDGGQFIDRGSSYKTAIFYSNEEEKSLAEKTKNHIEESGEFSKPIVTKVLPLGEFYDAEDYHQDFFIKNPIEYAKERKESGRDEYIKEHWKNFI
ncbi:peptide-methionine (S)-S-oxide reductase MsrA [Clostridium hydrogeniformans]|uniref:peptide-methionine (S)-S-oxide reductase MsrA n=1 Tax=Clostridium hydrogeniformans TaxID=349933 RepID=UPI000484020E|nr:peptide-methionine (S)-S-oxide reductase MsrA [Clostridium hydrogeniformans]